MNKLQSMHVQFLIGIFLFIEQRFKTFKDGDNKNEDTEKVVADDLGEMDVEENVEYGGKTSTINSVVKDDLLKSEVGDIKQENGEKGELEVEQENCEKSEIDTKEKVCDVMKETEVKDEVDIKSVIEVTKVEDCNK